MTNEKKMRKHKIKNERLKHIRKKITYERINQDVLKKNKYNCVE